MGSCNGKRKDFDKDFEQQKPKIQTVFQQISSQPNNVSVSRGKEHSSHSKAHSSKRKKTKKESTQERLIRNQRINTKYQFKAVIRKGSFSRVLRVENRSTKQPYAIKIMNIGDGHSQFEAELSVLRRVNHPHVIHLIEVIETGKTIYMVMELATGGSLLDRLETIGCFSETEAVKVVKMVLSAVTYLHNLGITHRDLKPDNLLYYHPGNDSKIMVTDFGFASTPKSNGNPYMHTVCGTPQYVAPEIVARRPYTRAVDMWAVGVMTYIILSCTFPFDANKDAIIYKLILKGSYSMEGGVWEDVSDSGKKFIKCLLQREPERRPTAAEASEHIWIQNVEQIVSDKCHKATREGSKSSRSTVSSVSRRFSKSLRSKNHRVQTAHLDELQSLYGSLLNVPKNYQELL